MPGPEIAALLAYGPGPPVDLIPYFLGLAAWAGMAIVAVLMSPLNALLRRLRRKRLQSRDRKGADGETAP